NVSKVNSLASQIAQITGQIANQQANGATVNDLEDQRAGLVTQLSAIAGVHEIDGSDGSYQLTIGNNRLLVFDTQSVPLSTQVDINGMTHVFSGTNDITSEFKSGELSAAVDARDNYIPKYLNSLDQLASDIVNQVNQVHSTGYDLNGNTGIDLFTPL